MLTIRYRPTTGIHISILLAEVRCATAFHLLMHGSITHRFRCSAGQHRLFNVAGHVGRWLYIR